MAKRIKHKNISREIMWFFDIRVCYVLECAHSVIQRKVAARRYYSQKKTYTNEKGDCCEKRFLFSFNC